MPGEGDQEKGSAGNRSLEDLVENFDPVCLSRPHRPASEVGDNRVIEAEGGRRDLADEAFVEGFSQLYGELGIIREAGDGGALFLCSTTQDPFLPVFQQVASASFCSTTEFRLESAASISAWAQDPLNPMSIEISTWSSKKSTRHWLPARWRGT